MKRLCALLLCLGGPGQAELFIRSTYIMGTVATVKVYAPDEPTAQRYAAMAFAEWRRLEDIFTSYRDSELTRLNRAAADAPAPVSEEMFELLRLSAEYSRKYQGAFDVTVGPAVRAWGFLGGPFHIPAPAERQRLRALVSMDGVELDTLHRTVHFKRHGMELDFGGIAKGYAAQKVAELLAGAGLERGLVDLGGSSLFALGAPPGRSSWPVTVIDPRPAHEPAALLELPPHWALSTSGTYGRTFRGYSHLFDPRTAEPVRLLASATAICRSGAESEAAAKAVLLLPPEKRRRLRDLDWLRLEVRRGKLLRESGCNLAAPGLSLLEKESLW